MVGIAITYTTQNYCLFIIISSFIHNCWIIMFILVRWEYFILYLVLYLSLSIRITYDFFKNSNLLEANVFPLIGIPPFFVFLMKWSSVITDKTLMWAIILASRGIIIFIYFKILYISIYYDWSNFHTIKIINWKNVFLYTILLFVL